VGGVLLRDVLLSAACGGESILGQRGRHRAARGWRARTRGGNEERAGAGSPLDAGRDDKREASRVPEVHFVRLSLVIETDEGSEARPH